MIKPLEEDTAVYIDLWDYYEMNINGLNGEGIAFAKRLFNEPINFYNRAQSKDSRYRDIGVGHKSQIVYKALILKSVIQPTIGR